MGETACLAGSPNVGPPSYGSSAASLRVHSSIVKPSSASAYTSNGFSNGSASLHGFINPSAAAITSYSAAGAVAPAGGQLSVGNSNNPSSNSVSSNNGVANGSYSNGGAGAAAAAAAPNGVASSNSPVAIHGVIPAAAYSNGSAAANGIGNANGCVPLTSAVTNGPLGTPGFNKVACNGHSPATIQTNGVIATQYELPAVTRPCLWYEEEIDESLRWCFGLKRILHTGVSKFQEIALLETQPFGKVLTLDKKLQSAEMDEWVYHECLVHPALLLHSSPKNVFIMGGGEGSTAREALRHRGIRKVVMCDIDEEVVKFCRSHLTMNSEAFQSSRLDLVINDARAELENREERFDIIIGDLADPMEGGPCYQLYSKGFYESVLKPRMNPGGIFVTQAGPAGVLSHKEVFSSIFNTLRHVFAHVVAYSAHVPSFADTWGWVMASDQPFGQITSNEIDGRIKQRVKGELRYLDGATLSASTVLNKTVRQSLEEEKHIYTENSARFVHGHGRSTGSH